MIEVEKLSKSFGSFKALDNVNFSAKKGQICGFLGPNGAGKTTTMRILAGFSSFDSGKVIVNGFDVEKEPLKVKESIGYLPENLFYYEELNILEYLSWAAKMKKLEKPLERINEVMEMTGITHEQKQMIQTLSRGYKQRLGFATALLANPPVLILDEPTNGLDPLQIIEMRKLIQKLGKEKTILISSHILSEIEATCDQVVLINQGKIVFANDIQTIKSYSQKNGIPFTLKVENNTEAKNILKKAPYIIEYKENSDSFKVVLNSMLSRKNLILDMMNAGILEFAIKEKSLESIFQQFTKN